MKILVLSGSPRKKDSYNVCKIIEEKINKREDIIFEYLHLASMNIKECKGCDQCFQKGEKYCPIKDDINLIKEKIISCDGIIFASPVYAVHITASFKKVIDRLSYLFHRPELIGKPALNVVTTAGGGKKVTANYLKMTASGWGCNLAGTIEVVSPMFFKDKKDNAFYNPKYYSKVNKKIDNLVDKFYNSIIDKKLPRPTFYDIFMFNGLRSKTYTSEVDYEFWNDRGWLESNYYYKTRINPIKKVFGALLNTMIKAAWKRMQGRNGAC